MIKRKEMMKMMEKILILMKFKKNKKIKYNKFYKNINF